MNEYQKRDICGRRRYAPQGYGYFEMTARKSYRLEESDGRQYGVSDSIFSMAERSLMPDDRCGLSAPETRRKIVEAP